MLIMVCIKANIWLSLLLKQVIFQSFLLKKLGDLELIQYGVYSIVKCSYRRGYVITPSTEACVDTKRDSFNCFATM